MKSIVFAGHFTVGEKLTEGQLKSIQKACSLGIQIGILVNEIDFERKIRFYQIGGKEMVIKHYDSRKKCGTTDSVCKLLTFEQKIALIDWDVYEFVVERVKGHKNISQILREELIPALIQKRIQEYNLSLENVKIYTERQLRNRASIRLAEHREQGTNSWIPQLRQVNLLSSMKAPVSGIPVCKAIMVALYEILSKDGYTKLIQIYSENDKFAIESGKEVCLSLKAAFPEDTRWNFEFENFYFPI